MPVYDASSYPGGARPTFQSHGERNTTSAYTCDECLRFIASHGRRGHEDMHAQFAAKAARNVFTDAEAKLFNEDFEIQKGRPFDDAEGQ